MHACLLDVATWTSPPLVVRMVESGRWSLDRGLAYARVSTLAPWKVWILASLAPRFGSLWEGAVGEEDWGAAVPPDGQTVFVELESERLLVTALPSMLQRKMLTLCRDRGVQFYASALAAIGRHAPNILTDTDLQIFEKMLAASDLSSEYRASVLARIARGGVPIVGGTARARKSVMEGKRGSARVDLS